MGVQLVRDLPAPVAELHLDVFEAAALLDDDSVGNGVPERVGRDVLVGS